MAEVAIDCAAAVDDLGPKMFGIDDSYSYHVDSYLSSLHNLINSYESENWTQRQFLIG